jgi:hypothetical protein
MLAFIQCILGWYSPQYYDGSLTWISTNITNIYLISIRFGTLQYHCNTLYKSHRIPMVFGFLPYTDSYSFLGFFFFFSHLPSSGKMSIISMLQPQLSQRAFCFTLDHIDVDVIILTPKCHPSHFVAYEWQWTGLNNRGRPDFIQDFWGSLVGNLCTTFNWKITLGCLPLSIRMNFAKKTDYRVVYFF